MEHGTRLYKAPDGLSDHMTALSAVMPVSCTLEKAEKLNSFSLESFHDAGYLAKKFAAGAAAALAVHKTNGDARSVPVPLLLLTLAEQNAYLENLPLQG